MASTVTRQTSAGLWHVDAAFADALFPPGGEGLLRAMTAGRVEPVKGGSERQTGRVTVGGKTFYVKEFQGPLAAGRTRREWQVARRAFAAGLSTPRPVAATWQGGAVYVTEAAPASRTLSDLVYEEYFEPVEDEYPYPGHRPPELVALYRRRLLQPRSADVPSPRELGRMIAELLVELHSLGLRHGDLHPGNLLVVREGDGERPGGHGGPPLRTANDERHPPRPVGAAGNNDSDGNGVSPGEAGGFNGNGEQRPPPVAAACNDNSDGRADTRSAPTTAAANDESPNGRTAEQSNDRTADSPTAGRWRLMVLDLVDLSEMPRRASPAKSRRVVVGHLVKLNHFFEPLATRSERFRALVYLERRGLRVRNEAARLQAATWQYRWLFYRGRDKRCLRSSKYFERIEAGHFRGFAVADVADELPDTAGGVARVIQIHESVKRSRRETSGFGHLGEQRVFIKRDTRRGWRAAGRPWPAIAEHVLRGTRQRRAWQRGNALLVRGVRTARPLVWLDVEHSLAGREGIVVCEVLGRDDLWRPLDEALPEARGRSHTRLVEAVARTVRRMHDAGISNRDLKAQNILVKCSGDLWQVALVDMVGVRVHCCQVGLGRRMQNLMRLAFSWSGTGVSGQARGATRTDRLRFLKTYLGPHMRQTITVASRRLPARGQVEALRRWWRGINFALYEKAQGARRAGDQAEGLSDSA